MEGDVFWDNLCSRVLILQEVNVVIITRRTVSCSVACCDNVDHSRSYVTNTRTRTLLGVVLVDGGGVMVYCHRSTWVAFHGSADMQPLQSSHGNAVRSNAKCCVFVV